MNKSLEDLDKEVTTLTANYKKSRDKLWRDYVKQAEALDSMYTDVIALIREEIQALWNFETCTRTKLMP